MTLMLRAPAQSWEVGVEGRGTEFVFCTFNEYCTRGIDTEERYDC